MPGSQPLESGLITRNARKGRLVDIRCYYDHMTLSSDPSIPCQYVSLNHKAVNLCSVLEVYQKKKTWNRPKEKDRFFFRSNYMRI
jgi:hypothetical protein